MPEYTFFAAMQTTGQVVGEIELLSPEFTKRLLGGTFRAYVPLTDLSRGEQIDILEITKPGKYSIVLDIDGRVFGEWFIWGRERRYGDDKLAISGAEPISHLEQRMMRAADYQNVEQLQIADQIARLGFGNSGGLGIGNSLAMEFPSFTPSGRTRVRVYDDVEAEIGQRLKELSQVIDGFDYDVEVDWQSVGGLRYVRRQFKTYYPRKGETKPFVFDLSREGGNATELVVTEDARTYASRSWALGSDNPDTGRVLASSRTPDSWTPAGFPFRERSISKYSVKEQSTIQAHANSFQVLNQTVELPGSLTVYTDTFPSVLDYVTGDVVLVQSDPIETFPEGWGGAMRIQGITVRPNQDEGAFETADLEMVPSDTLPGTQEDES